MSYDANNVKGQVPTGKPSGTIAYDKGVAVVLEHIPNVQTINAAPTEGDTVIVDGTSITAHAFTGFDYAAAGVTPVSSTGHLFEKAGSPTEYTDKETDAKDYAAESIPTAVTPASLTSEAQTATNHKVTINGDVYTFKATPSADEPQTIQTTDIYIHI